jgi:hypothetical protein
VNESNTLFFLYSARLLGDVHIFLACTAFAGETPSKMTHAIIQMSGSGISADSFSAKPKTFWRASNQYCRVEEEADPERGIHGRMVINEPNAWLVNLADNTAKHLVDPGPTFNCKLPIFAMSPEMAKSKISELEIGRELEFFKQNGAKLIEGPKLQFEAKYYEVQIGDYSLRLVERVDTRAPIMIGLKHGSDQYLAHYLLWEEVPFKSDLFAKPEGVKVEEAK